MLQNSLKTVNLNCASSPFFIMHVHHFSSLFRVNTDIVMVTDVAVCLNVWSAAGRQELAVQVVNAEAPAVFVVSVLYMLTAVYALPRSQMMSI